MRAKEAANESELVFQQPPRGYLFCQNQDFLDFRLCLIERMNFWSQCVNDLCAASIDCVFYLARAYPVYPLILRILIQTIELRKTSSHQIAIHTTLDP